MMQSGDDRQAGGCINSKVGHFFFQVQQSKKEKIAIRLPTISRAETRLIL